MRLRRRVARSVVAVALLALVAGCSSDAAPSGGAGTPATPTTTAATPAPAEAAPTAAPALDVTVLADGLDHPWDVAQAPDGTLLVDERAGRLTAVRADGTVQEVQADFSDLFADGETGLMGLVLAPDFAQTRRFLTCQGLSDDDGDRIAVLGWTVDEGWTTATREPSPVLDDIPVNEGSGRHGGCRLRIDGQGQLLVGTGDNAVGTNPQDLTTLAGKLLRVDPVTGAASPGNPFADAEDPRTRLVLGYGHRNVQGVAVRPGGQQVFTVEQGSTRDDEVNLSTPGGNYGWDPVGSGSYDESVPMTDPGIDGAVAATWSSGDSTIATSGGTFLDGEAWGGYDGLMLVGVQKDQGVLALRLDEAGGLVEQFRLPELDGSYGRIRTVQQGTDGALYVTTDNGDETDQLLRVIPRG